MGKTAKTKADGIYIGLLNKRAKWQYQGRWNLWEALKQMGKTAKIKVDEIHGRRAQTLSDWMIDLVINSIIMNWMSTLMDRTDR